MRSTEKQPIVSLLIVLSAAVVGCGPLAPDLTGVGKGLGKINQTVACALSTAGSADERLFLSVDMDAFNDRFLSIVKPLNIKSVEVFEASALIEAKEFVKSLVDQAFEKLDVGASDSMHSKEFYFRLATRAFLIVIYDVEPLGNWRFGQAEYIQTAPNEKTVKRAEVYLSLQNQNLPNLNHPAIVFCDE